MPNTYSSVDEAAQSDSVLEKINEGTLRVQPYGNAIFFNSIYRSENIRVGNLATFENGDIKVNVTDLN
jgi:hypothetical protein